jgi:hypothetical protein
MEFKPGLILVEDLGAEPRFEVLVLDRGLQRQTQAVKHDLERAWAVGIPLLDTTY